MDRHRVRFLFALTLFVGWVIALGTMAVFSAHRPEPGASPRPVQ